MTFLLPFLVFMVVGAFEPTPETPGGEKIGLAIPYAAYPWVYAAKIALTVAAMVFVWPGYREFPLRITAGHSGGRGGRPAVDRAVSLDWEHAYLSPLLARCGLGGLIGAGTGRRSIRSSNSPSSRPGWTFLRCGSSDWSPSCR